jgi:hypothetical protein
MLLEGSHCKKFTFERKKLVTTTTTTKREVRLLGDLFSKSSTTQQIQTALQNNVIVSPSGDTLSEMLSLSYPDELSRYAVESVCVGWGKSGTVVTYSHSEGTEVVIVSSINPTHPLILV